MAAADLSTASVDIDSSTGNHTNADFVKNSTANVEEMLVDITPVASDREDEMRTGCNSNEAGTRLNADAVHLNTLMEGINLEKLENRAQRFGVVEPASSAKNISESELKMLYKSLDIDPKELPTMTRSKKIRLDSIHMRGVNEMNTDDIFDYFKEYGPATVEWVNDHSCNIIWTDVVRPARAMVDLSQPIKRSSRQQPTTTSERTSRDSREIEDGEDVEMSDHDATSSSRVRHYSASSVEREARQRSRQNSEEQRNTLAPNNSPVDVCPTETDSESEIACVDSTPAIDASTIEIPIPPGPWRLGIAHPKAKSLLLRFAFKLDRKIVGAEKMSQYYIRYGNPNYQGLKGIISTSLKRKIKDVHHRPGGYVDLDAVNDNSDDDDDDDDDAFGGPKQGDPVYNHSMKQKELPKRPRMRMYADDEEEKFKKAAASIPQSILTCDDLRNRIGSEKFSFIGSVTLDGDVEGRSDKADLRTRLSLTRRSHSSEAGGGGQAARDLTRPSVIGDLRSKLEKLRQSRQPKVPLLIEIAQNDI